MPSKNDFDMDEREFNSRVQLPTCPDLALLYATREGVLPDAQAGQIRTHMSHCEICTHLFEDLDFIDFGTLTATEAAHIHDRIQREAPRAFERPQPPASWLRKRWWVPTLAVAACAVVAFFVFRPTPMKRPATPLVAQAHPLPEIPLEKLALHIDATALLSTRGASDGAQPSASELVKGLQKYQNDDFDGAAEQLKVLAQKYPQDGTVHLYLGVSELFLHQDAGAADALTIAAAHNRGARLADSQWYLAMAELRVNNPDSADPLLHDLCQGKSGYSQRACEIESQLK